MSLFNGNSFQSELCTWNSHQLSWIIISLSIRLPCSVCSQRIPSNAVYPRARTSTSPQANNISFSYDKITTVFTTPILAFPLSTERGHRVIGVRSHWWSFTKHTCFCWPQCRQDNFLLDCGLQCFYGIPWMGFFGLFSSSWPTVTVNWWLIIVGCTCTFKMLYLPAHLLQHGRGNNSLVKAENEWLV